MTQVQNVFIHDHFKCSIVSSIHLH